MLVRPSPAHAVRAFPAESAPLEALLVGPVPPPSPEGKMGGVRGGAEAVQRPAGVAHCQEGEGTSGVRRGPGLLPAPSKELRRSWAGTLVAEGSRLSAHIAVRRISARIALRRAPEGSW